MTFSRSRKSKLLFLLSLWLVVVLSSCTRDSAAGLEPHLSLILGDDPATGKGQSVVPGDPVDAAPSAGFFWVLATFDAWPFPGDCWMTVLRPSTAIEFRVNGIRLDSDGRFPPDYFIESGKSTVFRIPAGMIPAGSIPRIEFRMYSDGGITKIPHIQATDDPAIVDAYRMLNWLSIQLKKNWNHQIVIWISLKKE